MYTSFFGLSDSPFSIAPNPEYLFLGDRHKEALAHLSYGLGDTGGFVLLTGEVGTGKTTLSRRLLEQVPENTQVAFILNPTLSCIELLATICDELNIRYKKTGVTLKYLTDKIQQKLLRNHSSDINTLLIIDEAQHLQPEVLEQLRLLTNLETNTKKLLQVVLIGQPELQQLLQRRDLRQLAQRITARYHLLPLTVAEVEYYIKHRLSVADCHRLLFKPSAVKLIHKISKGIPRLINVLCDRALATAYGNNDSMVNRKTVFIASEQALGSEYQLAPWWQKRSVIGVSVLVNIMIIVGLAFWFGRYQVPNQLANTAVNVEEKKSDKSEQVPIKPINSTSQLDETLATVEPIAQHLVNSEHNAKVPVNTNQADAEVTFEQPKDHLSNQLRADTADSSLSKNSTVLESKTIDFDISQIEGVSPDLLAQVQRAIADTGNDTLAEPAAVESEVLSLMDMPEHVQNRVPALQFEVHIYATGSDGWIRVNGRERYEGDIVAGNVKLAKILQDKVVLELDGKQFSLPALSTW